MWTKTIVRNIEQAQGRRRNDFRRAFNRQQRISGGGKKRSRDEQSSSGGSYAGSSVTKKSKAVVQPPDVLFSDEMFENSSTKQAYKPLRISTLKEGLRVVNHLDRATEATLERERNTNLGTARTDTRKTFINSLVYFLNKTCNLTVKKRTHEDGAVYYTISLNGQDTTRCQQQIGTRLRTFEKKELKASDERYLYVVLRINGMEVPALVDTGASTSTFPEYLLDALALRAHCDRVDTCKTQGVYATSETVGSITLDGVFVGGKKVQLHVNIRNNSASNTKDPSDFLLGYEFLKMYNCSIHLQDKQYPGMKYLYDEGVPVPYRGRGLYIGNNEDNKKSAMTFAPFIPHDAAVEKLLGLLKK